MARFACPHCSIPHSPEGLPPVSPAKELAKLRKEWPFSFRVEDYRPVRKLHLLPGQGQAFATWKSGRRGRVFAFKSRCEMDAFMSQMGFTKILK